MPDRSELAKKAISDYQPVPAGNLQYPLEYIEENRLVKLSETDERLTIGVCSHPTPDQVQGLKRFHQKALEFVLIENADFSSFLSRLLAGQDGGDYAGDGSADRMQLDQLANDAPIINLVNSILIEGIAKGASDIHIECFEKSMRVRFRIDGVMTIAMNLPKDRFAAVASRIKIMTNLNIMETRLPQDGRISVELEGADQDMRVSILPTSEGESIVIRLFNRQDVPLTLEELGFVEPALGRFRGLYKSHHGLILATGPTGSGKTTTLNAALREIVTPELKIITIEDPVEYQLAGVDQVQTNDKIGLTFDSVLRRVLRQDPDIIMVGEIRDYETADLAVRAALTGHLVFSTLHTNDSVSVISRLRNMGVEPFLLAAVLRGALAQRLVRRLCPACKQTYSPKPYQSRIFERHQINVDHLYHPVGCPECKDTGYSGRIGLVELFTADEELETLIVQDKKNTEIQDHLLSKGMLTLVHDGLTKCADGVTSFEEIERTVL